MNATADRVLDVGRQLFNQKGYAATTLAEIAREAGIAQGNLTYHFPTKHHIVLRLREEVMAQIIARNERARPDDPVDAYVERLTFIVPINSHYRCLLRDRMIFDDAPEEHGPTPEMVSDFDELVGLLGGLLDEGLVRRDIDVDLTTLARSLWIVGRHWPDHLLEMEGRTSLDDDDIDRGIEQHRSVLGPHLTAEGRRRLDDSLTRSARTGARK